MLRVRQPGAAGRLGKFRDDPAHFQTYDHNLTWQRDYVFKAIRYLLKNTKGLKSCNDCFKRLPRGFTFDQVLMSPDDTWISYCPETTTYGYADRASDEISICQLAFDGGVIQVAATIVHELAHIVGAPSNTHAAEATLPPCGFGSVYDKGMIGMPGFRRSGIG
jgi:hypothetical protein